MGRKTYATSTNIVNSLLFVMDLFGKIYNHLYIAKNKYPQTQLMYT